MTTRRFLSALFWTLLALAVLFHIGGGWYFSGILIEDAFVPEIEPAVAPAGEFELTEVTYSSRLGEMDAWHLPASGSTWVIHVHGKGGTPAEAEHLFVPIQQAGYPQLSIAYRNDDGQPLDPSGYYQYGVTEWEDIAGAVAFAEANGATSLVFSGFSTGASHVLSYLYRHNVDNVHGLFLDSPNVDMGDTVTFNAGMRELPLLPFTIPATLSEVAKFLTSLRIGVNWKTIDYIDRADTSLRVPVLVHHGSEDVSVPVEQSRRLEAAAPDLVDLVIVEGAGHVDSYEADPEKYVASVLSFLGQLG